MRSRSAFTGMMLLLGLTASGSSAAPTVDARVDTVGELASNSASTYRYVHRLTRLRNPEGVTLVSVEIKELVRTTARRNSVGAGRGGPRPAVRPGPTLQPLLFQTQSRQWRASWFSITRTGFLLPCAATPDRRCRLSYVSLALGDNGSTSGVAIHANSTDPMLQARDESTPATPGGAFPAHSRPHWSL